VSTTSAELERFHERLEADSDFRSNALTALRAAEFEPTELLRFGQAAGYDLQDGDFDPGAGMPEDDFDLDDDILATEANSTEACTYTCGPECQ